MKFRIKEILKEQNLLQKDLAEKMGVSLQNVKLMLNKPSLTTATLEKVAEALDVPVWQLLVAPQEMEPNCTCPNCGTSLKVKIISE